MENIFSQMGLGTKQLADRYSEYTAPAHDPHVLYTYEPSTLSHGHVTHVSTSKHNYGGGLKSGASMSALTLLAFLFFLHILQQCIKDHMTEMATPPVMIMTAGREGDDAVTKSNAHKIDKSGITQINSDKNTELDNNYSDNRDTMYEKYDAKNPYEARPEDNKFKITNSAENRPKTGVTKFKYVYNNNSNRGSYPGYINAMEEDIVK